LRASLPRKEARNDLIHGIAEAGHPSGQVGATGGDFGAEAVD
jgi:hypothetical protein